MKYQLFVCISWKYYLCCYFVGLCLCWQCCCEARPVT